MDTVYDYREEALLLAEHPIQNVDDNGDFSFIVEGEEIKIKGPRVREAYRILNDLEEYKKQYGDIPRDIKTTVMELALYEEFLSSGVLLSHEMREKLAERLEAFKQEWVTVNYFPVKWGEDLQIKSIHISCGGNKGVEIQYGGTVVIYESYREGEDSVTYNGDAAISKKLRWLFHGEGPYIFLKQKSRRW